MNRFAVRRSGFVAATWMFAAWLILALPKGSSQTPPAAQPGGSAASANIENGKKLYRSVGCWACHGYEGQGSIAGVRIGPLAVPAPSAVAYVRHPRGQMPPYTAKALKDSDLLDIFAFLQTIPKPPPVKDIPLLNE